MGLNYVDRDTNPKDYYFSDEDNTNVCEELKIWRPKRLEAREQGLPMSHAVIPEFTALQVKSIIEHLASRYNYSRYWFRDEMVNDALINALTYLHTFDPEQIGPRSGRVNFHSWVTTSAERVFSNRIESEEEQVYHKLKSVELGGGLEAFTSDDHDVQITSGTIDNSGDMGRDLMSRIYEYEEKRETKKQRQKDRRLERQAKKAKPPKNKLARLLKAKKEKKNEETS